MENLKGPTILINFARISQIITKRVWILKWRTNEMYDQDWEGDVQKKDNVLVMILSFLAMKLGTIVIL